VKQRKTPFFLANNKYSTRGDSDGRYFRSEVKKKKHFLFAFRSLIRTLASPKVLPFGKEKKKMSFFFCFSLT